LFFETTIVESAVSVLLIARYVISSPGLSPECLLAALIALSHSGLVPSHPVHRCLIL